MDDLICPSCQKEGKKSVCHLGQGLSTDSSKFVRDLVRRSKYSNKFWDEDGKQHNHSTSTTKNVYQCSNDHYFIQISKKKERCGACKTKREISNTYEMIEGEGIGEDLQRLKVCLGIYTWGSKNFPCNLK